MLKLVNILVFLFFVSVLVPGCSVSPEVAKEKGFALYDLDKIAEALPYLERAYTDETSDPELVVRLAYCLANVNGDVERAITILRDAALRYPDYARIYYQLGYLAFHFGPEQGNKNVIQALGFTRRAAVLDPENFHIADNMGMYFLMLDEPDSALTWFLIAQKLDSEYAELNERIALTRKIIENRAQNDSTENVDILDLSDD